MLDHVSDNEIKIYTCGITVYSQPHIGNWVGYIYWDVLVRFLEHEGFSVKRVQNYTDVGHLVSDDDSGEDKMEAGARREGKTAWDVADIYIKIADKEAYELLGLKKPGQLVRATAYIPQQIKFVADLEAKGYTYMIPDEGIYFDTSKIENYGKLARLDVQGLQGGVRVSVSGKRNVTDFALWKFSPKEQKRDMEWDSPWGRGFPGWHLECSVIARETLGDQIDIHTGGIDHIPIHHTNEIAQTEALTGKPFSSFWLHNNHLKVDGQKMAKSVGNILTLQDILDKGFSVEAFKVMILSKHYQTEGNFTWDNLEASENRLKKWRRLADLMWQSHPNAKRQMFASLVDNIKSHLNDDLNTPLALGVVDTCDDINHVNTEDRQAFIEYLRFIDDIFGLNLTSQPDISENQKEKLLARQAAKDQKNWTNADLLRDELMNEGIGINDTEYGQVWYRI